ncbi:MAG: phage shock protein A [Candidatus Handelsmanbacteria bacterium RIFCSPLOWO2_12_FULL_64_10]|uniref:Phage shock protein A n=1 Tax=Handelsmanbacteria sp. (strain RIFCSPLOWO2_12_FULL_64_10) TaxID=1817868 RepID=A0A1F6CL24_HANXR|nr:MAG: phage shock protein A [Candidatus Handelsmanbacteria bacterium RIFCSPLOWO2_12_FULL_64_10]
MGLFDRMATVIKSWANQMIGAAEDPRKLMDYSYEKQHEMLQQVRRGVLDVATAKRQIELQAEKEKDNVVKLEEQARRALASGREDLARLAIERKQVALARISDLETQMNTVEQEQQRLAQAEVRVAAKIEAFKTHKEVIKAQYSAAEAEVRVGEAVSGLSEEFADLGLAMQRAEEKTEKMKARASAINELTASGTLELPGGKRDDIELELEKLSLSSGVEAELAAMKRQIDGPEQPKALTEGR